MKHRPSLIDNRCSKAGWALLAACLCLAGCSAEDPRLQSLRDQFLVLTEPTDPTSIAVAKEGLAEDPRVELVGRITEDEHTAFTQGRAFFIVTEILPDEHGHADHDDNCPFCKRKAATAPQAAVQFVDASGEALIFDAQKLFGVEPGDTVVIRGTGELMAELDLFVVTADGIHIRQ